MKTVYIAHPLIGTGTCDPEANYAKISEIARKIAMEEPDVVPLSPVHAFSFLPWTDEECDALARKFCAQLLSLVDELRVYGDWSSSKGCQMEIECASDLNLPVVFRNSQAEGGIPRES